MKWKEGFAKATGKPYAFWTCPTKLPDGSWCPTKGPKGAPGASAPSVPSQAPSVASGEVVELLTRIAVAEATRLLESIDSRLNVIVEILREISLKDNPLN